MKRNRKIKMLFIGIFFFQFVTVFSQKYEYFIDLVNIQDDKIIVELKCPEIKSDKVIFSFPASLPGTYMYLNYGILIEKFRAYDADGKKLRVRKVGKNSYRIKHANQLARITYVADDSYDSRKGRKIRRQAGTSFEAEKNFLLNAAGVFGFFEGMEKLPVELEFKKPQNLDGYSSLNTVSKTSDKQVFSAASYHQVIDCPIMFALPDTCSFKVGNCKVMIVTYAETGHQYSKIIYENIKPKMLALEKFFGELPVDNYTFIFYLKDMVDLARQYEAGEIGWFKLFRLKRSGATREGAFEHPNSSSYYYCDAGDTSFIKNIRNSTVHEFLHIITPLNLHSGLISDFNYTKPQMSKHLWLYEGVTEYFNHLSLLQAGELNTERYLQIMRQKIANGSNFPYEEMSFTQMSENSLEDKYNKQYSQVYQRGAILAWLLDAEIIRLTNGTKNLKDVVFKLSEKYGQEKSFNEDNFIQEFVSEVHPDLQKFFDKYICGYQHWELDKTLKNIGIEYFDNAKVNRPRNFITDNDIQVKSTKKGDKIKKVGPKEWAGFKEGDIVSSGAYLKYLRINDEYVPEGTIVNVPVKRKGDIVEIPIHVIYKPQDTNYVLLEIAEKTEDQQRYFNMWIGFL